MLSPIITVLIHFPLRFFLTVFVMVIVSVYMYRCIKRRYSKELITKKQGIILWTLINYVIVLLFFTIFGRRSWDYYRYNFEVGYSYLDVLSTGNRDLAVQIVANIVIFIPIGFMSCYLLKRYAFYKSVFCGIVLSLLIELLQFLMKRGCCEIDDLISNLIGTILGCLIITMYRLVKTKKARK